LATSAGYRPRLLPLLLSAPLSPDGRPLDLTTLDRPPDRRHDDVYSEVSSSETREALHRLGERLGGQSA
jgi:hypothetical protein